MWFVNGDRYEGAFVNGLFGGSGTYSGVWRDGCLDSARIAIDKTLAECGFD